VMVYKVASAVVCVLVVLFVVLYDNMTLFDRMSNDVEYLIYLSINITSTATRLRSLLKCFSILSALQSQLSFLWQVCGSQDNIFYHAGIAKAGLYCKAF